MSENETSILTQRETIVETASRMGAANVALLVKMLVCCPDHDALATAITSSIESKVAIGTTGPAMVVRCD